MPWRFLRAGSKRLAKRRLEIVVEGQEHLPRAGPVVIAARHYHHLYDGVAFHATIHRPVHILVTVDWLKGGLGRKALVALCGSARWPAVVRTDPFTVARTGPVPPAVAQRVYRRAVADAVALLREGRILIVFPEGYPNVDPNPTPKRGEAFLPFQSGFVRIARMAERSGAGEVPIVPVGLSYERGPRWRLTVRYGPPVAATDDAAAVTAAVERRVRELSGLPG